MLCKVTHCAGRVSASIQSNKMSLCLNLAKTRVVFALARIGCRRQTSKLEEASNRGRWNKYGAKAEGLRRLHTSASLFTQNVFLKLHYPQCIPSLDTAVLHKLLTKITIVCISEHRSRPPPSRCPVSLARLLL